MLRRTIALVCWASLAVMVAGCSGEETPSVDGAHARQAVADHLTTRQQAVDGNWPERRLKDLLPNHVYRFAATGQSERLASGLVVGEVVDAVPGAGYFAADDAPKSQVVGFYEERAQWRAIEVHVRVEHSWGDVDTSDGVATFGIAVGGDLDPDVALAGFKEFGRIFVVLSNGSFFSHNADLDDVRQGQALLGRVSASDELSLPFMEQARIFLGELRTVGDLRRAAGQGVVRGKIDSNGAIVRN